MLRVQHLPKTGQTSLNNVHFETKKRKEINKNGAISPCGNAVKTKHIVSVGERSWFQRFRDSWN